MVDLTEPLIEQARYSLDQLRQALGWLDEAKVPGRGGFGPPRHLTDAARERLDALAREERAERYPPPRTVKVKDKDATTERVVQRTVGDDLLSRRLHDRHALAGATAPVRLGVTVVLVRIHAILLDVTGYLVGGRDEDPVAVFVPPAGIRPGIAAALGWLSGEPVHPLGLAGLLDGVRDHDVAEWVSYELDRANRMARQVCGVSDQVEEPRQRDDCPSCGRRSLYENHTATDPRHWYVFCDRPGCRCVGPGCPCGRPRRVEGERHYWYGAQWLDRIQSGEVATTEECSCCCHVGGYARPVCDVAGGCGSVGCDGSGRIARMVA